MKNAIAEKAHNASTAALIEAAEAAREYFSNRADAEYLPFSSRPRGNEEMRLFCDLDAALKALATAEREKQMMEEKT